MTYKKTGKCSLCEKPYKDYGHNPEPLKRFEERCCDDCNVTKVIPERLKGDWKEGKKEKNNYIICKKCGDIIFYQNAIGDYCEKCWNKERDKEKGIEDLGICVRCKKNKATLVFTESTLSFAHGFTENICQRCYEKMQRAHPLYKKAKEETLKEIEKGLSDWVNKWVQRKLTARAIAELKQKLK